MLYIDSFIEEMTFPYSPEVDLWRIWSGLEPHYQNQVFSIIIDFYKQIGKEKILNRKLLSHKKSSEFSAGVTDSRQN